MRKASLYCTLKKCKKSILLLLFVSVLGVGCLDLEEIIHLKKDGTGHYTLRVNMSSVFSNSVARGYLDNVYLFNDSTRLNPHHILDTTIQLKHLSTAQKQRFSKPAFWNNVSMRLLLNENKGLFLADVSLPFKSFDDIRYLHRHLHELQPGAPAFAGSLFAGKEDQELMRWKKKKYDRLEVAIPQPFAWNSAEEKKQANLLFSTGVLKTAYYMPGKIRKTNIPGAQNRDSLVLCTVPLLQAIEKGIPHGWIKVR